MSDEPSNFEDLQQEGLRIQRYILPEVLLGLVFFVRELNRDPDAMSQVEDEAPNAKVKIQEIFEKWCAIVGINPTPRQEAEEKLLQRLPQLLQDSWPLEHGFSNDRKALEAWRRLEAMRRWMRVNEPFMKAVAMEITTWLANVRSKLRNRPLAGDVVYEYLMNLSMAQMIAGGLYSGSGELAHIPPMDITLNKYGRFDGHRLSGIQLFEIACLIQTGEIPGILTGRGKVAIMAGCSIAASLGGRIFLGVTRRVN